jgi:hypothetical protein
MSAVLREQGIVTIHDQVVSLVAQRWAKAFPCKVTIHTGLKQNPGLILSNSAISSGGR